MSKKGGNFALRFPLVVPFLGAPPPPHFKSRSAALLSIMLVNIG